MPENDYQKNKVDAMDDVEMENEAVDLWSYEDDND
jgi:hypothetical protein